MKISLVARIALLVTTVILVAFAALLAIVHQTTSRAFVHSREIQEARSDHPEGSAGLAVRLGGAYDAGGLDALRLEVERLDRDSGVAIVLDDNLDVIAASDPRFSNAAVRADGSTLHVVAEQENANRAFRVEFFVPRTTAIETAQGEIIGSLVLVAAPPDRSEGDKFAGSIWRTAGAPLLLVALGAMLAVIVAVRLALKPIERLTRAAWRLQRRETPEPLAATGDIELDRLIEAFNAAATAIAQADDMRRSFIADIAHELRTPVTNLRGQLDAVQSGLLAPGAEFQATMRAEVGLLERLVDDFQELALSDAGKLKAHLCTVSLRETLEDILLPLAEQSRFDLDLQIPDEINVTADPERLRQVVYNLVENSVRHRREGLHISVEAHADHANAVVAFSDNGPGISAQDQPHIFERFYRAEKSRNRATGGAGLGLAIAKSLMELMHGEIVFVDRPGPGATFELVAPLAPVADGGE